MNIIDFQNSNDDAIFYDRLNNKFSRVTILQSIESCVRDGKIKQLPDNEIKESIRRLLDVMTIKGSENKIDISVKEFMEKNKIK